MKTIKNLICGLALLSAWLALPANAQNRINFAGVRNAVGYNFGGAQPAPPPLFIGGTNYVAAGTNVSLTVLIGQAVAADGQVFNPLSTTAKINIGIGANTDTVTPSAVSCSTPNVQNTCTITVTTTYGHGIGEPISSATVGLQEALNVASVAGGEVAVDSGWTQFGGTTAMITSATPYSNVWINDNRGLQTSSVASWSMQPSTLTVLAAPTTLTSTNVVFTSATGTWAASSTHFIATCVDALGGESAGSADYTQTPTVNYTLTVSGVTCATGAVGWRMYAGTSSAALSYLLPITSTACTLATAVSSVLACALGSTGTWAATFTTTTALAPLALGVTNQNNPVTQGHTTFAYAPTGSLPVPFQTHYGPFGSGTIASATNADVTVLGTVHLPPAYLNTIGRTVRITGKIIGGATASGTMNIVAALGWAGGDTAGLPVTACNIVSASLLGTQTYTFPFSCTLTTNAVGATAIGTVQPDSWFIAGGAAGTTNVVAAESSTAAIGSLGLFAQNDLYIYITPGASAITATRLMDLHIETLQ